MKRPGLQLRARPGYLAMTAVEAERATSLTTRAGPPAAVTEALATLAATKRRSLIAAGSECRLARTAKQISFLWNPTPPCRE